MLSKLTTMLISLATMGKAHTSGSSSEGEIRDTLTDISDAFEQKVDQMLMTRLRLKYNYELFPHLLKEKGRQHVAADAYAIINWHNDLFDATDDLSHATESVTVVCRPLVGDLLETDPQVAAVIFDRLISWLPEDVDGIQHFDAFNIINVSPALSRDFFSHITRACEKTKDSVPPAFYLFKTTNVMGWWVFSDFEKIQTGKLFPLEPEKVMRPCVPYADRIKAIDQELRVLDLNAGKEKISQLQWRAKQSNQTLQAALNSKGEHASRLAIFTASRSYYDADNGLKEMVSRRRQVRYKQQLIYVLSQLEQFCLLRTDPRRSDFRSINVSYLKHGHTESSIRQEIDKVGAFLAEVLWPSEEAEAVRLDIQINIAEIRATLQLLAQARQGSPTEKHYCDTISRVGGPEKDVRISITMHDSLVRADGISKFVGSAIAKAKPELAAIATQVHELIFNSLINTGYQRHLGENRRPSSLRTTEKRRKPRERISDSSSNTRNQYRLGNNGKTFPPRPRKKKHQQTSTGIPYYFIPPIMALASYACCGGAGNKSVRRAHKCRTPEKKLISRQAQLQRLDTHTAALTTEGLWEYDDVEQYFKLTIPVISRDECEYARWEHNEFLPLGDLNSLFPSFSIQKQAGEMFAVLSIARVVEEQLNISGIASSPDGLIQSTIQGINTLIAKLNHQVGNMEVARASIKDTEDHLKSFSNWKEVVAAASKDYEKEKKTTNAKEKAFGRVEKFVQIYSNKTADLKKFVGDLAKKSKKRLERINEIEGSVIFLHRMRNDLRKEQRSSNDSNGLLNNAHLARLGCEQVAAQCKITPKIAGSVGEQAESAAEGGMLPGSHTCRRFNADCEKLAQCRGLSKKKKKRQKNKGAVALSYSPSLSKPQRKFEWSHCGLTEDRLRSFISSYPEMQKALKARERSSSGILAAKIKRLIKKMAPFKGNTIFLFLARHTDETLQKFLGSNEEKEQFLSMANSIHKRYGDIQKTLKIIESTRQPQPRIKKSDSQPDSSHTEMLQRVLKQLEECSIQLKDMFRGCDGDAVKPSSNNNTLTHAASFLWLQSVILVYAVFSDSNLFAMHLSRGELVTTLADFFHVKPDPRKKLRQGLAECRHCVVHYPTFIVKLARLPDSANLLYQACKDVHATISHLIKMLKNGGRWEPQDYPGITITTKFNQRNTREARQGLNLDFSKNKFMQLLWLNVSQHQSDTAITDKTVINLEDVKAHLQQVLAGYDEKNIQSYLAWLLSVCIVGERNFSRQDFFKSSRLDLRRIHPLCKRIRNRIAHPLQFEINTDPLFLVSSQLKRVVDAKRLNGQQNDHFKKARCCVTQAADIAALSQIWSARHYQLNEPPASVDETVGSVTNGVHS